MEFSPTVSIISNIRYYYQYVKKALSYRNATNAAIDHPQARERRMNLQAFLPYRLAVVADAVSRALAAVYANRFKLTRDQWRVIAQLAEERELKATELGTRTSLPKMQVSRALAGLERDGLITRAIDPDDRRKLVVRLTAAGRVLYRKIEPIVLEREAFLLQALSSDERAALTLALARVEQRARQLQQTS